MHTTATIAILPASTRIKLVREIMEKQNRLNARILHGNERKFYIENLHIALNHLAKIEEEVAD